jgi:proteasome lid subunit RPN8/RPN11
MKNDNMKNATTTRRKPATLRFSPTAWAKLLLVRDLGDTEIGGFAIAPSDDLLFVEDLRLVRQTCSPVSVEFDDQAVADFFDEQVDEGRRPEQIARIWVHTHPANSPQPSGTDERTFERVFGRSDWALMFILARGGQCYARLRYNVGPGAEIELKVDVDYARPFPETDFELWRHEYLANVQLEPVPPSRPSEIRTTTTVNDRDEQFLEDWWRDAWSDYANQENEHEETIFGYIRDF